MGKIREKRAKKTKKSEISSNLLLQDDDLLLYNKKDNSITLEKQNWNSQDENNKKVEYKTSEINKKLSKTNELKYVGKIYYQN